MRAGPAQSEEASAPATGRTRHTFRHDVLALAGLGLVVALTIRGHFAVPHPDFHEFIDSGHAILGGRLPPTTKRAPLFGVIVVGVGRLLPVEAPERVAAEWLNALLLPVNALLVYALGRRWIGSRARWAGAWFVLLPFSLYCTAHVLAEPLLTCLMLSALCAVQPAAGRPAASTSPAPPTGPGAPAATHREARGAAPATRRGAWAYALAAAAALTRYDAAGLIAGLFVADVLRGVRVRRAAWCAALAAAPLGAWLAFTAASWTTRSQDHYLRQMAERPGFAPGWMTRAALRNVISLPPLRLPETLSALRDVGTWRPEGAPPLAWALGALVVIGAAALLRRGEAAGVCATVAVACYGVVHAAFPFHELRFGYPISGPLILAAGVGLGVVGRAAARAVQSRALRTALLVLAGGVAAAALVGEARSYAVFSGQRTPWAVALVMLVTAALPLLWFAPFEVRAGRLAQGALLLAMVLIGALHVRAAFELMGNGRGYQNEIEAARWIRGHVPPDARVLSPWPGLMRLYAGREPPDRFVAYEEIAADDWPDVLAECRRRGIRYIVWHDQLWQELGGYYAEKWRVGRFDVLGPLLTGAEVPTARGGAEAGGVVVERRFAAYPDLFILRVLD